MLDRLMEACAAQSIPEIRAPLKSAPTGYDPKDAIADLVWADVAEQGEARITATSRS